MQVTYPVYRPHALKPILERACDNNQNVLIEGRHGTGKTSLIKEVFDKKFGPDGWAYFSGSAMDPFLDFIGCPKERKVDDVDCLKMIRPERFAKNQIQAIFIDEFNRADKHTRNAVLELIQFGSMNGDKLGNLKLVWTAINPPNDDYDCDELDPAQASRFHIRVNLNNQPDREYFTKTYGVNVARAALDWWNNMTPDIQHIISPRTLDYALNGFLNLQMPLELYLPTQSNPPALAATIDAGPAIDKLMAMNDPKDITEALSNDNFFYDVRHFVTSKEQLSKYIAFFPEERLAQHLMNVDDIHDLVLTQNDVMDNDQYRQFLQNIHNIYKSKINTELCSKLELDDLHSAIEAMLADETEWK